MTYKLILIPDQESYSVIDGKEIIVTKLDGGKSRYRKDILNSSSLVNATWTLTPSGYEYIRSFYKIMLNDASHPFKIDLLLDSSVLTEHDAFFVPGTMTLTRQKGLTFVVSAQLEVIPLPFDTALEEYILKMISYFGIDWKKEESKLNIILNVNWPKALNKP